MKRRTRNAGRKAFKRSAEYRQAKPKGKSNYARKMRWLAGKFLWGFQVAEPKPWRSR